MEGAQKKTAGSFPMLKGSRITKSTKKDSKINRYADLFTFITELQGFELNFSYFTCPLI